jgi:hypothetical protein
MYPEISGHTRHFDWCATTLDTCGTLMGRLRFKKWQGDCIAECSRSSQVALHTRWSCIRQRPRRTRRRPDGLLQQRLKPIKAEATRRPVQKVPQRSAQLRRVVREQPPRHPRVRGAQHLVVGVRCKRDALKDGKGADKESVVRRNAELVLVHGSA